MQTTVNGLQNKVLNRAFVNVWSDWEKMVKFPRSFAEFKKQLKGKKILRVWRRAKNVVFELSGGYSLLVHMKMTGHLLHGTWSMKRGAYEAVEDGPLKDKINGYLHFIWFLDDGNMVALSDMRKFAKIELQPTKELLEIFEGLGPESLEKDFSFEKFEALFAKKRGKVKQVIMAPEFIAGVGNIYASEALWEARIHPLKDVSKLGKKELQALYKAIRKVLALGVEFGGDSFSDYRDVDGNKGTFEGQKKVYQRTGQPCFRCKAPIKRLVVAARSAFFCPNCQVL